MKFLKVSGHDGLVRDTANGAIINTNVEDYKVYMAQRESALQRQKQITEQAEEINNIKNELSEIKSLLTQLLANK
jgi:hypothetical protein